MHACIMVITKEFPTDDVIYRAMSPFSEDGFYEKYEEEEKIPEDAWPEFTWDYFAVGGRYGGGLKLKIDMEDEEYRWKFYAKEPRAGRLFRSALCERMDRTSGREIIFKAFEDDYRKYMGSDDGYIRVDACKVKDTIDFEKTVLDSFGFINQDGKAICREYYRGKFEDNENYEEEVKAELHDLEDCYVTIVDTHS